MATLNNPAFLVGINPAVPPPIDTFLEIGQKRVFAGALGWPGWCRGGRDEGSALQALFDYAPRYLRVLQNTGLAFQVPQDPAGFQVIERLAGNSTTDFGAPGVIPEADKTSLDETEMLQMVNLLWACWKTFDAALRQAAGKQLRKGPRGGGRDQENILLHVLEADSAYLRRLAWKPQKSDHIALEAEIIGVREEIILALETAVYEGLPESGPRGGTIWPPRYFIRRTSWHVLDHAWEIEDRIP